MLLATINKEDLVGIFHKIRFIHNFSFFISLPVSAEAHHTFELLMKPGASSHGLVLKCKSWQPESPRETCEVVCHKLQICKQTGSNVGHALEESHYLEAVGLR